MVRYVRISLDLRSISLLPGRDEGWEDLEAEPLAANTPLPPRGRVRHRPAHEGKQQLPRPQARRDEAPRHLADADWMVRRDS